MKPTNRRPTLASSLGPQVKQRQQRAHDFKPVVAQTRTAPSAQSVKRPLARPVYGPQAKLTNVQAKMADSSLQKNHPVHRPVYKAHFVQVSRGAAPGYQAKREENWPVIQRAEAKRAAVHPRAHELDQEFKGAALAKNKQALLLKYYPVGANKAHFAHGSSKNKQFSMKDELRNLLDAISRTRDNNGYEAARQAINADFGTDF